MARDSIARLTGKNFLDVKIFRAENGKPFYKNFDGQEIFFSLSHSGPWVVCSLGDRPNGVDVETKQNQIGLVIAKRFFLPNEYEALKSLNDSGKDWRRKFLQYWTLKEAALKCFDLASWTEVDCEKFLSGKENAARACCFDLPDGGVISVVSELTTPSGSLRSPLPLYLKATPPAFQATSPYTGEARV